MKLMILTEYFEGEGASTAHPLGGGHRQILDGLLRQNKIMPDEYYVTSVFKQFPPAGNEENFFTKNPIDQAQNYPLFKPKTWVSDKYQSQLDDLMAVIRELNPNVILALGPISLWALTYRNNIRKLRGAPMLTHDGKHKVITTWAISTILKQWNVRPIVYMDIAKAKSESAFPDLRRPRRFIHIQPAIHDIQKFYEEYIIPAPALSVDIETKQLQITEIGFAPSIDRALVIPFYSRKPGAPNYWPTAHQEKLAWGWVKKILAEKPVYGQNFQYDMAYLWRAGIPCPKFIDDTMLLTHALEPELDKGLGFLGSIYTNEPAWKMMRQAEDTLKQADE